MRAIAIPFVGRAAPVDAPSVKQTCRPLLRVLLAVLDRLVPPHDAAREAGPPPAWYRFPPF